MSYMFNNATSSALYVGITSLVGLTLTGVSIGYLGAELYGLWVLITTILILGMFGEQGLGLPIVRLISADDERKNQEVLTTSILPVIVICIIIFLILFFVNQPFEDFFSKSNFKVESNVNMILPAMGVTVFCFLLGVIPTSFLIGYEKLYITNYVKSFCRILQLAVAFVLLKSGFSLWALVIALLTYHLSVLVLSAVIASKFFEHRLIYKRFFNKEVFLEIVEVGYKIVVGRIVGMGIDPLFKYSLGAILGLQFVTFYDVAFRVSSLVSQVPTIALKSRMPIFNKILRNFTETRLIKEIRKLDVYIILYLVPAFLFGIFGSELFLKLWLQDGYSPLIRVAILFLLPTMSLYIFAHSRNLFLISKGDSKTTLGAYIVNALILVLILVVTKTSSVDVTFSSLMASYCFSHICASIFIMTRFTVAVNSHPKINQKENKVCAE